MPQNTQEDRTLNKCISDMEKIVNSQDAEKTRKLYELFDEAHKKNKIMGKDLFCVFKQNFHSYALSPAEKDCLKLYFSVQDNYDLE